MRIYTIVIKIWLQTSVNFNVQFEIKISRASKNYCQKKFLRIPYPYINPRKKNEKKEKEKKRRGQCLVDEDTSISTSPENVDHSEIPKQPQLNPLPC